MLLLHLITLMIDARPSLRRRRTQLRSPPRLKRPDHDRKDLLPDVPVPTTFACLTHPVAQPCGAALVHPNRSLEQPGSTACITSLQCQTPAIAPLRKGRTATANSKISTEHRLNPKGGDLHTRQQPKTQGRPKPQRKAKPQRKWWSQTGSNRRPEACKATALPTELWPPLLGEAKERNRTLAVRESARKPFGLATL